MNAFYLSKQVRKVNILDSTVTKVYMRQGYCKLIIIVIVIIIILPFLTAWAMSAWFPF